MLRHRMEPVPVLSSQTLPKLDGQDEEGDQLVESQFEMLCATNSCPDLSVLEEEHLSTLEDNGRNEGFETVIRRGGGLQLISSGKNIEDQVDGLFVKHIQGTHSSNTGVASKIPLGFRRSTSLNSLGVDQDFGTRNDSSTTCLLSDNLNPVNFGRGAGASCVAGNVALISAQLDKQLKQLQLGAGGIKGAPINTTDFVRSKLRASDSGRPGYLHKSVSSPSVSQQFPSVAALVSGELHHHHHYPHHRQKSSNLTSFRPTSQSDAHQHSSKRSFFRRKHKFKGHSMNAHSGSQSAATLYSFDTGTMIMNGVGGGAGTGGGTAVYNNHSHPSSSTSNRLSGGGGDNHGSESSLGQQALLDPSLGLQDPDAECWALSMSSEVISSLDEKEVKRQEHMYELILTEKHHCLTLALMHHLFIGDMKKHGFARQARLLFPDLKELLQVHFSFLKRLRERQSKYRKLGQPVDTLSDILVEQFSGCQWQQMIRLYGLLSASHYKSLEIFRTLMKEQRFASLVATWDKEPLLARKNVRECLLLVAQRITKYPLLLEPLVKTGISDQEKEAVSKALKSSKELISRVNDRVDERQRLLEICQKIDPKSYVTIGQKRRGRDDLVSVPSRRLLFHGQAVITCNRIGIGSLSNVSCTVLILTDCLVFTQEFGGRLQFVCPPGIVMLSNLLVRPNAGQPSSMFLVISDSGKAEMIEIQVSNPPNREAWMDKIKEAKNKYEEKTDTFSDVDDELTSDAVDHSEVRTAKALEELQENDKQILALLRSRSKIVDILRADKPQNWVTNHLDGKETVMSAMSAACNEVRQMINHIDANHVNAVNRSTSCVGEIGSSSVSNAANNALQGLPKRADTFGGFDSQQRGLLGDQQLPPNVNITSRQLLDMVVQLEDVCGELFSLFVHQMSPIVYQNYYQLQRRMEDLREAQQRLETEKAIWQQEFNSQKDSIDKDKSDLSCWKANLQKEQEDITQQREQLYRKLEALQRNPCNCNWKGLVPTPDSISPGSSGPEKPAQSAIPRRPVIQPNSGPTAGSHQGSTNNVKTRQQLPLHLASFSSSKLGGLSSTTLTSSTSLGSSSSSSEATTTSSNHSGPPPVLPKPRSSVMSSFKSSLSASSLLQSVTNNPSSSTHHNPNHPAASSWAQPSVKNSSSASQVQQLLPLRLSEGTTNSSTSPSSTTSSAVSSSPKTSSLPRGVTASRSTSSVNQLEHPSSGEIGFTSSGRVQRHSGAGGTSHHPSHSNFIEQPANPSYLHGPISGSSSSERMNAYFSKPPPPLPPPLQFQNQPPYHPQTNGAGGTEHFTSTGVPIPIVHRRSGSSPVPMSSSGGVTNVTRNSSHHHHHHHHNHHHPRFFQPQDEEYDTSKILFL